MIFYIAGGTGGHLFPAIAIHQELQKKSLFIVPRKNPAEDILMHYNIQPTIFSVSKKELILFPGMILKALTLILKNKPTIIIAMGGSVCVPFAILGWMLRIPVIAFEQNALPGRAIRVVQFFSKKIITSFESTKHQLVMKRRVECWGNPVRSVYPNHDQFPEQWDQITGKTMLVIGGSQGAESINKFITNNKNEWMNRGWNIIHLTGHKHFNDTQRQYIVELNGGQIYVAMPFLINMNMAYKKATLVFCRAGATTLAEISGYQLPAILVPFPYAMDNHQMKNAVDFSEENAPVEIIEDARLDSSKVLDIMERLSLKTNSKVEPINNQTVKSICEFIKTYLK